MSTLKSLSHSTREPGLSPVSGRAAGWGWGWGGWPKNDEVVRAQG
jgi:hypothetical protein